MTSETQDLLDLLSIDAVEEAIMVRDRPQDRFSASHFKADIPAQELKAETRRPNNSNYDQTGFYLTVDITEIMAGRGQLGENTLWIRVPTARAKNPDRTEATRMLMFANKADPSIRTLRQIVGRKGVEFKEDLFEYVYDRGTGSYDKDGKEIWERNIPGKCYFYVLSFGSALASAAVRNGATVLPTEAGVAAALAVLAEAGPNGMTVNEFNLACSKVAEVKADKALISAITSGKFVADMVGEGRILRNGDQLVAV